MYTWKFKTDFLLNGKWFFVWYTHKLTTNGWFISDKIFFSFFTCSTCFSLITSAIAKIFIAQNVCVVLSRQRQTRPNVPVPANRKKSSRNYYLTASWNWILFLNYGALEWWSYYCSLNDSKKLHKKSYIARMYKIQSCFHFGN